MNTKKIETRLREINERFAKIFYKPVNPNAIESRITLGDIVHGKVILGERENNELPKRNR